MYFYRYLSKVVLSNDNYAFGNQISEEEARNRKIRGMFAVVSHPGTIHQVPNIESSAKNYAMNII